MSIVVSASFCFRNFLVCGAMLRCRCYSLGAGLNDLVFFIPSNEPAFSAFPGYLPVDDFRIFGSVDIYGLVIRGFSEYICLI